MKKTNDKDLDRLLKTYFQQESEALTPPSSTQGWAELRTRLENRESPALPGETTPLLDDQRSSLLQRGYELFKEHKALTSLAAACLLVAIYFAGLPPVDTLRQSFSGITTSSEADEASFRVETSGEQVEAEVFLPQEAPDPGTPPEQEAILADVPPGEELHALEIEVDATEAPDEARDSKMETPEHPSEETLARDSHPEAEMDMALEATRSLGFSEHSDLIDSLKGLSASLVLDEIWFIQDIPEGFLFTSGVISRSDTMLHSVTQSYASPDEERRLSLNQNFFLSAAEAGADYYSLDELAMPVQVGPYEGYLIRQQQGVKTITWLQEKSVVRLSGQLEDEQLFEIIEALESVSVPLEP